MGTHHSGAGLPFQSHTDFKILLITFKALNGFAPKYIRNILTTYVPECLLRSVNAALLVIPRPQLINKEQKAAAKCGTVCCLR